MSDNAYIPRSVVADCHFCNRETYGVRVQFCLAGDWNITSEEVICFRCMLQICQRALSPNGQKGLDAGFREESGD